MGSAAAGAAGRCLSAGHICSASRAAGRLYRAVMAISFNDATLRLLDGRNYAVLATINPDGSPHSSANRAARYPCRPSHKTHITPGHPFAGVPASMCILTGPTTIGLLQRVPYLSQRLCRRGNDSGLAGQ